MSLLRKPSALALLTLLLAGAVVVVVAVRRGTAPPRAGSASLAPAAIVDVTAAPRSARPLTEGERERMRVLARLAVGPNTDGRNVGSLFQARFDAPGIVCGAGSVNSAQTRRSGGKGTVEFFCRSEATASESMATSDLGATSRRGTRTEIDTLRGRLVDLAQDTYLDDERRWTKFTNPVGRIWNIEAVAGKPLSFLSDGRVHYDGETVATFPVVYDAGTYYRGQLYVIGTQSETGTYVLASCAWTPSSSAGGDFTYAAMPAALGHAYAVLGWKGSIYVSGSPRAAIVRFDQGEPTVVTESDLGEIYGIVERDDHLLFGTFPSGYLYRYDGAELTDLAGPPLREGQWVGDRSYGGDEAFLNQYREYRESQTLYLRGGQLWVGMYPWGHLWYADSVGSDDAWRYARLFEYPSFEGAPYPYKAEVDGLFTKFRDVLPEKHPGWLVRSAWGQRITSIVPYGDGLAVGLGNCTGFPLDDERDAILSAPAQREYTSVVHVAVPNSVTAMPDWTKRSTLVFAVLDGRRLVIIQDDQVLAETAYSGPPLPASAPSSLRIGQGLFGTSELELEVVEPGPRNAARSFPNER
ncbi:MAG: hypothetical protein ACYTGP_01495 [Planctomycetota bacterium]|jgi:hypothetical protein